MNSVIKELQNIDYNNYFSLVSLSYSDNSSVA